MAITFVTSNPHKAEEVSVILGGIPLQTKALELPEIQTWNLEDIVREKALAAYEQIGGPVLVEDVSFRIEALGGFPGPFVKFWLHEVGYDRAVRIAELMEEHEASPTCGVGYADENGFLYVEGTISGQLVSKRGAEGFGFDPYFMPDGYDVTFAEMGKEEKNKISHRRKGFDAMKQLLQAKGLLA